MAITAFRGKRRRVALGYPYLEEETLRDRRARRQKRASGKREAAENRAVGQAWEIEKAALKEASRVRNRQFRDKFNFKPLLAMADKISLAEYKKKALDTIKSIVKESANERAHWEIISKQVDAMYYKNPCHKNPRKKKAAKKRAPRKGTKAAFEAAAKKAHEAWLKMYKAHKSGKYSLGPLFSSNPRVSFPKTKRGRKPKIRAWVLEMYGANGKKLGGHIIKRTKAAAEKVAKSGVGKNFRGKRIHRIVMDGPH